MHNYYVVLFKYILQKQKTHFVRHGECLGPDISNDRNRYGIVALITLRSRRHFILFSMPTVFHTVFLIFPASVLLAAWSQRKPSNFRVLSPFTEGCDPKSLRL